MEGIIYVLTNPLMPDLVMIKQDKDLKNFEDLKKRVQDLSTCPNSNKPIPGVPAPFEIYCAWNVLNADHDYLKEVCDNFADYIINPYQDSFKVKPYKDSDKPKPEAKPKPKPKSDFFKINPDRDFFRVNPERVFLFLNQEPLKHIEIGKNKETEDVTGQEERLSNRKRRMRTKLKFSSLGIPPGSTLTFIRDNDIKATVANDDLNVILEGEEEHKPLWQATLDIMNNRFEKKWSVTHGPNFWGPDCWVYENESLSERRIRMESGE